MGSSYTLRSEQQEGDHGSRSRRRWRRAIQKELGSGDAATARTAISQETGQELGKKYPTSLFSPSDLLGVPPISQAQLKGGGREESR